MATNVLVSGGAGFIGSHLVRRLVERGDGVRVLDDFSTGQRARLADLEPEVEVVEGDLRDLDAVAAAVGGIEVVFHQAALPSVQRSFENPTLTTAVIAQGTLNLLLAARDAGVRRVVHASSSSVYGDSGELPRVESARPAPVSPYAVAKLAAEGFCETFGRAGSLETIALRYFNVYGPGQDPSSPYSAAVPRFIQAIQADEPVVIYGDGGQSRDFTSVDDVVEANVLAAACELTEPALLNIGAGRPATVLDVAEAIGAVVGRAPRYRHEPPRPGEVRASWADVREAERRLGYAPRTSLEDGLRRTVEAMATGSPPSAGSRGGTPRSPARA